MTGSVSRHVVLAGVNVVDRDKRAAQLAIDLTEAAAGAWLTIPAATYTPAGTLFLGAAHTAFDVGPSSGHRIIGGLAPTGRACNPTAAAEIMAARTRTLASCQTSTGPIGQEVAASLAPGEWITATIYCQGTGGDVYIFCLVRKNGHSGYIPGSLTMKRLG